MRFLRAQQRLDGAALVHRAITLRDVIERQRKVEDLPGFDGALEDQIYEVGQVSPHRSRAAVQPNVGKEERLTIEADAVRDAYEANPPAWIIDS
jgi:hypothetical protein